MYKREDPHRFYEQRSSYVTPDVALFTAKYIFSSSRPLYDGWHSDSMDWFRKMNGKPAEPIDDPDVADFVHDMHMVAGVGSLAVYQNRIHVGLSDERFHDWSETAHDIRRPIAALAIARFPESAEVEFAELPLQTRG